MRGSTNFLAFALLLTTLFSGCAFHKKDYLSNIEIDGKNYRGSKGDEGAFYIHDEPLIRLHLGCYKRTSFGQTAFPLIPLPVISGVEPHASVGNHVFSFKLSHGHREEVDFNQTRITLQLGDQQQTLQVGQTELREYRRYYEFLSSIPCKAIEGATLEIQLPDNHQRRYQLNFEERVVRKIRYHAGLAT